jgi:hypothetical protein
MLIIAVLGFASGSEAYGQRANSSAAEPGKVDARSSVGEVVSTELENNRILIKADPGDRVVILLDGRTICMQVAPGEHDLAKAIKIAAANIKPGDRVYARGKAVDGQGSLLARQVILMAKEEVSKKQQRDRDQWTQHGIAGVVKVINSGANEIVLQMRGQEGAQPMVITTGQSTRFRRYPPDSVKFADAKPSSFHEIRVGDQVRALGKTNSDGTHFISEEIVSGDFQAVGGIVTSVNPETREVKISSFGTKQPLTIVITRDTMVRRISPALATTLISKPGNPGSQTKQAQSEGQHASDRSRTQMTGDLQETLERQPPVPLDQIRQNDVLVVSTAKGANPSRIVAITCLLGIDLLINQLQGRTQSSNASQDPIPGLPPGITSLGLP